MFGAGLIHQCFCNDTERQKQVKHSGFAERNQTQHLCCERCALSVQLQECRLAVVLSVRFRLTCGARRLWWWTVWRRSIRCRSRLCRWTSSTAPACVTRPRRSAAAYSTVHQHTHQTCTRFISVYNQSFWHVSAFLIWKSALICICIKL